MHVGGHGAGYTVKLMINLLWFAHLVATAEVLSIGTRAGVGLAMLRRCLLASPAEQIYRRARAQYGDDGGEMLPVKLYEDLTRTPLRLSTPPGVNPC